MDTPCICHIRDIYRAISAFENKLIEAFGVNINEAMLLCLLAERQRILAGEIADELRLTRSNASKVIAAMEKAGNVRRFTCSEDSRCQRFELTKHGRDLLSHIHCDSFQVPEELRSMAGQ